jgi:DNA-binding GntR family transcriptional regulator
VLGAVDRPDLGVERVLLAQLRNRRGREGRRSGQARGRPLAERVDAVEAQPERRDDEEEAREIRGEGRSRLADRGRGTVGEAGTRQLRKPGRGLRGPRVVVQGAGLEPGRLERAGVAGQGLEDRVRGSLLEGRLPAPRSASAAAGEVIREAIIDGRLPPGQRLKEEELARELGMSRTPVREALLMLESDGLVESIPRRGATVRSYAVGDLDDVYQLRALLEGYSARRAARRISTEDVARLEESCDRFDRLRAEDDLPDLVKENLLFHSVIHEAAASDRLGALVRKVIEIPLVYKSFYWYSPEQKLISQQYHRQLTRALRQGDGERAELIMKEHVLEARDFLLAHLGPGGEDEPA